MTSDFANKLVRDHRIKLAIVVAMLIGCCIGCGTSGSGTLPQLIPVKGKVTFKGQPLTMGTDPFRARRLRPPGNRQVAIRRDLRADHAEGW